MNSGMNRLGFTPQAFRAAWHRLSGLTQVDAVTLMTHFADADMTHGIDEQVAVFASATEDLPGDRSLHNSAACLRFREQPPSDWIRAGIMLYGSSPDHPQHDSGDWQLQPAMSLRSRLIAIQHLRAGDRVGYGGHYTAERPMRIGIVACGYADGYPRLAPDGTPVLVDGMRCALVGRVSMDMIAVDLTPVPHAGIGSEVTLWGRSVSGAILGIDEVAHAAGTLGYELMCALAARVRVHSEMEVP